MDAEAVAAALVPQALAPPIAKRLNLAVEAVEAALGLLAEGAQPAFLIRYRPERVAGLRIQDLEHVQAQAARAAAFEFKRQEVREELDKRGATPRLLEHLRHADHPIDLEDLRVYLRRRKRGPAAKARGAGLGRLAERCWAAGTKGGSALAADSGQRSDEAPTGTDELSAGEEGLETSAEQSSATEAAPTPPSGPFDFDAEVGAAVGEAFATEDDVRAGVRTICAEDIASDPPLRKHLRALVYDQGKFHSRVIEDKKDKAGRYTKHFDRIEPCKALAGPTVLGVHRGEREGLLSVDIEIDPEAIRKAIVEFLGIDSETPAGAELAKAADEAWAHGLGKAVTTAVRKRIKERADREAIADYCEVLRPLLLAPPFGEKRVLAIDPGHHNGCRVVVVDEAGEVLAHDTVFPLQPKLQVPQAKARIAELCTEHAVQAMVVGSGNGGREVERLCRQLIREQEGLAALVVASVDIDAAALYASSRQAKEAFADADAAMRRAVALARRLQDPLRELSRVDPRKLGLGQHQHEVDQEELRSSLEQVIASSVSEVTVDVNKVPADQLARIAGMSQALSKAVLAWRENKGRIRSRAELLEVPGFVGKAFEQASGFLRIVGGEQPLDATMIHPERYQLITQMARDLGVIVPDLLGSPELVDKLEPSKYLGVPGASGDRLGELSLKFILNELRTGGADARPPFETVEYHPDLQTFEDLKVGMELEGIITHLAGFGAFVDVGLPQEGLVHVSELSHGFVNNPLEAVHVGQRVRGRVIEVSPERKRFSLSLKALMPRPERPPRPAAAQGKSRGKKEGQGGGKPRPGKGGPKDRGGPPKERPRERVLGFRLDLSELAERLEKG